ncbi:MAG: transposase [Luteolibacter sp.]
MRFFNKYEEVRKTGGKLPHWEQPGATYFLTWRLADSIPEEVMVKWRVERDEWLLKNPKPWDEGQEVEYGRLFSMEIERLMDKGQGSCVLRKERVRAVCRESFGSGDGERYEMHSWVVMPNHVHLLFSMAEGESLEKVVGGWKKFTARRINELLGVEGALWQRDYFDTMIRDWEHMYRAARYVRRNPVKAKLREGEFDLYEAEWVGRMLGE